MTTAKDCLATFAVAALVGAADARDAVFGAVDRYLAPLEHSPLSTTVALYELLDAFAELRIDSAAAREIYANLQGRLQLIGRAMIIQDEHP